jgi:hypothetical protein
LAERVSHSETGFVSPQAEDFVDSAVRLLTDGDLWQDMHRRCVTEPTLGTWKERAGDWEALFKKLL